MTKKPRQVQESKQSESKEEAKNASESTLKIDIPSSDMLKPRIIIFGVGGAGGNAINNMIRSNLEGVEFVAANTDAQALKQALAKNKIQLGLETTKGLGAGSFPDRGRASAEENVEEIERYLEGAHMVFIAAGMGGGTGTGAAPVIAKLARERDILTVGVVTKPFFFEGKYRMEIAEAGIDELKKYVDTLIVIPNQNLFRIANESTTFESAFKMADDVLHAGVRGVTDLITMPGLVNLDFADIRTIMTKMGKAMMGTGEATGENRAVVACEAAISNPLLDDISIKGAKGVLVNMTGGPDMTLFEADMAVNAIKREVDPSANIIFGSAFNEDMKGAIRISLVATGIDVEEFKRDSLKTQEIQEPSRFRVDFNSKEEEQSSEISAVSPATKSFFDPGLATKSGNEEIEEISGVDFQAKKSQSFLKEPKEDYGEDKTKKSKESEKIIDKVSALTEEITGANDIEITTPQEIIKKKKEKPQENLEKEKLSKSKKETAGFSLFSFMNSSKAKMEEEKAENAKSQPVKERMQNSSKTEEIKESSLINMIAKEEDSEKEEVELNKKSTEALKKHREFFGSTVFDEKSEGSFSKGKVEDDILNVPAFFRRKK